MSVSLEFIVTEKGDVTDIKVVESGGRVLDETVVSVARQWKYSPAMKDGAPVKVKLDMKLTFRGG